MHYQLATHAGRWDDGREERLLLSFVLAAAIVAAVLALVRLPTFPPFAPVIDLVVRIVQPEQERPAEAASESAAPESIEEPAPGRPEPGSLVQSPVGVVPTAPSEGLDLDGLREGAVQEYLDRTEEQPWAFDPRVDELRREGRLRYQPPTIDRPGSIWENVERDQLGRTVLRDGDCWKVIEDPNVGSQYQFQEFGQYMTMCTFQPRGPQELPWVDTIRERYDYLQYPDGEMPEQSRD